MQITIVRRDIDAYTREICFFPRFLLVVLPRLENRHSSNEKIACTNLSLSLSLSLSPFLSLPLLSLIIAIATASFRVN